MESRECSQDSDETSRLKEKLDKLAEDIKKLPPDRANKLESIIRSLEKKAVTLREASEILSASIATVRRAVKSGKLKSFQLNAGGNVYIPLEEIERVLRGDN